MNTKLVLKNLLFLIILLIGIPQFIYAQTITTCQNAVEGTISLDRKDWNNGTTVAHSEGIHHNFSLPNSALNPCKLISSIDVTITVINFDFSSIPVLCGIGADPWLNTYIGCPTITGANCSTTTTLTSEQNGVNTTQTISITNPTALNGLPLDLDQVFSVDIIPVIGNPFGAGCQSLITDGFITMEYDICIDVNLIDGSIDMPVNLGLDQNICPGETTPLDAGSFTDYIWAPNGETSQSINVGDGTYSVTVTDGNGCTGTDEIVVSEDGPSVSISSDDPDLTICNGTATILTATTTASNILWSTGETTNTISVGSGSYQVTVTDANSCTATDAININPWPIPNIDFTPAAPVACMTGTALVTATPGYSMYVWDAGAFTGNPVNLPSGSYDLVITDGNGCTNSATIVVGSETPPNAGTDNSIIVCNDNSTYDFTALLGAHDTGGTWTEISSSGVDINIDPTATSFNGVAPGSYSFSYSVSGTNCPSDDALISVTVESSPFGGTDAVETICDPSIIQNFLDLLGNPDPGGIWNQLSSPSIDLSNPTQVDISTLTPGIYLYSYDIQSGTACPNTSTTLEIIIPETAGEDITQAICEGSLLDLNTILSGSASSSGTFVETSGTSTLSGSLVNTTGQSGLLTFDYVVGNISDPCGQSIASININVQSSVDAGSNTTNDYCGSGIVDLNSYLSGAETGGNFEEVIFSGALSGSLFDTDLVGEGSYSFLYIVGNGITCPFDTSQIDLNVFDQPSFNLEVNTSLCEGQCDSIVLNFTGSAPFDFILDVSDGSSSTTNILMGSTSNSSIKYIVCVDGGNGSFSNDTLHLSSNETQYELTMTGLEDVNCILDLSNNLETNFVQISSSQLVEIDTTICSGDTVRIAGMDFYEGNESFSDTISLNFCDSITQITVDFYDLDTTFIMPTLCFGDSINVGGTLYNAQNPEDTLRHTDINGCDSVTIIQLSFYEPADSLIQATLCTGQFIVVNGETYDETNRTGQEVLIGQGQGGCDSTVTIDLSFGAQNQILIDDQLCPDEEIIVNGNTYNMTNPTGTELLPGATCDTLVTIDLSFYDAAEGTLSGPFCTDYFIILNGTEYNMTNPTGIEVLPNSSINGCDSTVNINLSFHPIAEGTFIETICEGDSIDIGGVIFNMNNPSGMVTLPGASVHGCDSVINVDLTFVPQDNFTDNIQVCEGDSAFIGGLWYYSSDTVDVNLVSQFGCDSIITTILTVVPCQEPFLISSTDNICGGGMEGYILIQMLEGMPPFTITWNGATSGEMGTFQLNMLGSYLIENLISDSYSFDITDSNGDVLLDSTISIIDLNPLLDVNINILEDIICYEDRGSIVVDILGGLPDYTIQWDDPLFGNSTIISELPPGDYLVRVIDVNNCTDSSSIRFEEVERPFAQFEITDVGCQDEMSGSIELISTVGLEMPISIFLDGDSVSNNIAENLTSGTYRIELVDGNTCVFDTILIVEEETINSFLDYEENYTISFGESIILEGDLLEEMVDVEWIPDSTLSCLNCPNPIATPSNSTTYTLTATNMFGCQESINIIVNVVAPEINLFVPNVITPNGDQINDELQLFTNLSLEEIVSMDLKVYNRLGNIVFQETSSHNQVTWNGKYHDSSILNGVYAYIFTVDDIFGGKHLIKGDVTVLY